MPAGTTRNGRQRIQEAKIYEPEMYPARESQMVFFWQQRGAVFAGLPLSLKTCRQETLQEEKFMLGKLDYRATTEAIKYILMTIEKNPGPGRDKTEEGKRKRRERRYKRRQEKRKERKDNIYRIATWNVQRMSLGTRNRRKLKEVAKYVEKNDWQVVLLSEVRSEDRGTVWLGEGENLIAVVYTNRAAIMLRGSILMEWCKGGQVVKASERNISIMAGNMILVSTYQPVATGNNHEECEAAKEDLKIHISQATRNNTLIVGGDFNAHIGAGEERAGTCGVFGIRGSNEQGRLLLEWLDQNNLTHVDSFYNMKRRGTWFHPALRQWYELDGFIMRNNQRHKFVRKVCLVGEASISDHKPKLMLLELDRKLPKRERVKRTPRIQWMKLRDEETARRYREKVEELMDVGGDDEDDDEMSTTNWDKISEVAVKAAEEVCGKEERKVENPWLEGKDEEIQVLRSRINGAVTSRNNLLEQSRNTNNEMEALVIEGELTAAKNQLKEARRDLKRRTRLWEREWWQEIIDECESAGQRGDTGAVYKHLKKLGQREITKAPTNTTITTEQFQQHFMKVSEERFENRPEEIEEILEEVDDISMTEKAAEIRERIGLEETPSREEILEQMGKMKDSAPGKDGVRLSYILKGGPALINEVIKLVQFMFENPAIKWEESLKIGLVIPLFKKGNRNDPNNFRGVVLLAMGSRILGRIMANRVRIWAELLGLLDEEQAGFRKGRSTADVTQLIYRIQEDAYDLRKRKEAEGIAIVEDEKPAARLLDLRKAYPRVNKFAMWEILKKCGMGEKSLRVIRDLHETTSYKVKGIEGESEPWVPQRGLREGGASSPPLFNIFHQAVMRVATKARKRKAEELGLEMGISFRWVPGSSFPGESNWEKANSEAKRVRIDKALFADDTTKIGHKKELEEGVKVTKEVMNKFEERNNDNKEESLIFGYEGSEKIRMLGVWMGEGEDVKQRLKRAGMSWSKVKNRLKGSKLSKKMQAKIVEACVESTLLFDCQTRTWHQSEIKKLQSLMDRQYRYIWSNKRKPPLIQMQEEHVNMQDVRNQLGVKSVRIKIEKRVLERIGHIFRMEDDRQVKIATLGWLEELEGHEKRPGKKRKTVLYWKRLLKEAGIDWTKISMLTRDRKAWKITVRSRAEHLQEWERKAGHRVNEVRGERNTRHVDDDFICDWEGCGKICKSKAGLTNHRKRIHEISNQKVMFNCQRCGETFKSEANLKNHNKICTGIHAADPDLRQCDICQRQISKGNFARHYRKCNNQVQDVEVNNIQVRGPRYNCPNCGKNLSKSNRARHEQTCL